MDGCQLEPTSECLAVAGHEIVDARVVDEAVARGRDACDVPAGVTTSSKIEPDPACLDRLDPTLPHA